MNRVTINGRSYTFDNVNNIDMSNGKIMLNGQNILDKNDGPEVTIIVEGDVSKIEGAQNVMVTGNAGSVKTQSGDVEVGGNIEGSVKTMSGDVKADGNIEGPTSTMSGDIISRR